jgi:hypothetical protein
LDFGFGILDLGLFDLSPCLSNRREAGGILVLDYWDWIDIIRITGYKSIAH